MGNPTQQSWSDTTTDQKIQINTGSILTKTSYFNFVAAKGYVENQRTLGFDIDPSLLKQAFYEGLIQGEVSNDGTFKNGLDAIEAAFIADNFVYQGTGLIKEKDQFTILSYVDDPAKKIIISSGSNSAEEYFNNNIRTGLGSTTGDTPDDIDALTGVNPHGELSDRISCCRRM